MYNTQIVQNILDDIVKAAHPCYAEAVKDCGPDSKQQQTLYFGTRNNNTGAFGEKRGTINPDDESDKATKQAIAHRQHLVIETTGSTISYFVALMHQAQRQNYNVIIAYPYVDLPNLQKRAKARQASTGQIAATKQQQFTASMHAASNIQHLWPHTDELYIYNNAVAQDRSYIMFKAKHVYEHTPNVPNRITGMPDERYVSIGGKNLRCGFREDGTYVKAMGAGHIVEAVCSQRDETLDAVELKKFITTLCETCFSN